MRTQEENDRLFSRIEQLHRTLIIDFNHALQNKREEVIEQVDQIIQENLGIIEENYYSRKERNRNALMELVEIKENLILTRTEKNSIS